MITQSVNMVHKLCTRCKMVLPATLEYFAPDKRAKNGLQSACRNCCKKWRESITGKEYTKRYNRSNRAKEVRKKYKHSLKGKNTRIKLSLQEYGITLEEYDRMFKEQNGVCAICDLPEIIQRLSVDHNHRTGKIRGLLCSNCNMRLSVLEDKHFILKATKYLGEYNG